MDDQSAPTQANDPFSPAINQVGADAAVNTNQSGILSHDGVVGASAQNDQTTDASPIVLEPSTPTNTDVTPDVSPRPAAELLNLK